MMMFPHLIVVVLLVILPPVARAGLDVTSLGKQYTPDPQRVPLQQVAGDTGGSTSIRNIDSEHLNNRALA